jgi:hypothetical protein
LNARLHTPEIINTVNLLMTDLIELDTAKTHKLDSEVVNYIKSSRKSNAVIQSRFGINLRIVANSVLLIGMISPLTFIPGLIIVVLPAGIYLLGKVYDDIKENKSRKVVVSEIKESERIIEETDKARWRVYGARLMR